jgi:hypothetical protein
MQNSSYRNKITFNQHPRFTEFTFMKLLQQIVKLSVQNEPESFMKWENQGFTTVVVVVVVVVGERFRQGLPGLTQPG